MSTYSVDKFISLISDENIDRKIKEKSELISILRESKRILNRSTLKKLSYPTFEISELGEILNLSIDSISKEAEKKVKEHLSKYFTQDAENWLKKGYDNIVDNTCPFCEQKLDGIQLIELYKQYFSLEYNDHKKNISSKIDEYYLKFNEQKLNNISASKEINIELLNEWKQLIPNQLDLPNIDYDFIKKKFDALFEKIIELLDKKNNNSLDIIPIPNSLTELAKDYKNIFKNIDDYNITVDSINQIIMKKKETVTGGDLQIEEKSILELKDQKSRYKDEIIGLVNSYLKIKKQYKNQPELKNTKKEKLNDVNKIYISKYRSSINKYLEKFNTDFRIVDQRIEYPGGRPSINYKIEIDSFSVNLGKQDTPDDFPSFKNTLSEGDKYSLAFAFFLAKLENDTKTEEKIVIIDDPVNSFDANRRNVTSSIINKLSQKVKQLIILTHEPAFSTNLKDIMKSNIKCFRLNKGNGKMLFKLFNPLKEFRGDYLNKYFSMAEYVKNGNGNPLLIAKSIRPLLEGNLKFRFPHIFDKENFWLGDIIKTFRECDTYSELIYLKTNCLEELTEINDYASKFHHENPNALSEVINPRELNGFVKRALKLCSM